MQLIYENKIEIDELSTYHFILIGMNYNILIRNDFVKIVPTNYKFLNFDRDTLENNTGILDSFFVLAPLSGIILSKIKNYKYFVLQYNKNTSVSELGFINKEGEEFMIKEKIIGGLKISEIKEGLDEDIFNFIKRLH